MALKARRSSELCSIWTLEFNLVQTSVVWKVHLGIFFFRRRARNKFSWENLNCKKWVIGLLNVHTVLFFHYSTLLVHQNHSFFNVQSRNRHAINYSRNYNCYRLANENSETWLIKTGMYTMNFCVDLNFWILLFGLRKIKFHQYITLMCRNI